MLQEMRSKTKIQVVNEIKGANLLKEILSEIDNLGNIVAPWVRA